MSFQKLNENIEDLNLDVKNYINAKYDYLKLKILKKTAQESSNLLKTIFISLFLLIIISLLSIGAAFWIGEELGRISFGFFIVAGFYLLIFIATLLLTKRFLMIKILNKLTRELEDIKKTMVELLNN